MINKALESVEIVAFVFVEVLLGSSACARFLFSLRGGRDVKLALPLDKPQPIYLLFFFLQLYAVDSIWCEYFPWHLALHFFTEVSGKNPGDRDQSVSLLIVLGDPS